MDLLLSLYTINTNINIEMNGEIGPLVRPYMYCGTACSNPLECQPRWGLLNVVSKTIPFRATHP